MHSPTVSPYSTHTLNLHLLFIEFCPQESFTAALKEDVPVGTVATKIHATDADEGVNGRLTYALLDGAADGAFRMDSGTGIVTLAKPLDREATALYNLTVRAMDRGSPR